MNENDVDSSTLAKDPSQFMRDLLIERKAKNKSYSANALARDLGLSQPFLSQIITGKRKLSLELKMQLASKLGVSLNHEPKTKASKLKLEVLQHTIEHEKILKHWYHFAILELVQLKNAANTIPVITQRLGINKLEAETAVARLLEFGYLKQHHNKLIRTGIPFIIDSKKSSQTLREFHQSRLKAASDELQNISQDHIDSRHFQTIFLPSSSEKVKQAKSMVTQFQKFLIEYLMSDEKDEVFQLSLQLFSAESNKKTKRKKT